MLRTPRMVLPAAAVALGAVVVLVAASTATGRSQATAPKNTTEPSITYVYPIKVGTPLTGHRGWMERDRSDHLQVPVAPLQRQRRGLPEDHQRHRDELHRRLG